MNPEDGKLAEVQQWLSAGWAVVTGMVPAAEIDAAREEVFRLVPSPAEYHRDPEMARRRWGRDHISQDKGILTAGPDFRPEQYRWEILFPFPSSPRLNQLCINPRLTAFVRQCLGTEDVRLYQAGLDIKYSGDTDYEQPLHIDWNHSLLPPSAARSYRHLEGFLYLTDVGTQTGATCLVAPDESLILPDPAEAGPWPSAELAQVRDFFVPGPVFPRDRYPGLYAHEQAAAGPRGSFLAYGPNVIHRGAAVTEPGAARVLLNVSYRAADQEWVGFHAWQSHSNDRRWREFVAGRTPDELSLFGFPRPGHPVWDADLIRLTASRYPGLDMRPWADALAD
jgi:hypothetical protein